MPCWQFAVISGEDWPKDAAQDPGLGTGTTLPSLRPGLNPSQPCMTRKENRCWSLFPPFSLSVSLSLSLFSSARYCGVSVPNAMSHSVSVCLVSSGLLAFSLKSLSDCMFLCICPSLSVSLSISLLSASLFLFFYSSSAFLNLSVSVCVSLISLSLFV